MSEFHDWDIDGESLVARHIHVRTSFLRFFERPVRIAHGTRALLFEDGAFRGEVGEGRHDHSSLAEQLGRKVPNGAFDVVVTQAGDLLVDHAYQGVESADHYPLDVRLQLRLVIRDPSAFFFHYVQQRKRVALADLIDFLEKRVESAARVAVKRFGIDQLREAHGGRDLRLALESELERETHDELLRIGLDLVHLATFEASNRRLEDLQERRVDLVFRREELKQEKAERSFDKDERAWREGERREDRDFAHEREAWDSDKDVSEARDRVQAWASMADVVRQRRVLEQGDLLELEDELDRQALDYGKAQDLRGQERHRFAGDLDVNRARLKTDWEGLKDQINLDGFRSAMARAEERADLEKTRTIGERARKLVLDKLEISQWAELTGHRAMKEAEVEALQVRIDMERLGQKAELSELGMKTEQRLNEVFLQGKAQELGLQEAVAEAARRASILALKHDISTEELGLQLDGAQGERSAAELRRALQQKVAVADFTREQAIGDAETAAKARAIALQSKVAEARADQDIAKGQIEVDQYAEERAAERRRAEAEAKQKSEQEEDKHDLEILEGLRKIKEAKDTAAAARRASEKDQDHQHHMTRAQHAAAQVLRERELALKGQELQGKHAVETINAEAGRDQVLKEMSADQLALRMNPSSATAHFDTKARIGEAEAQHSAAHEREKFEGILGARDQFDQERQTRDATDREERADQDAAARAEREADRVHQRALLGMAMGARGSQEADAQRHAQDLRLAERGARDEVREAYREGLAHTSAVAGAASPTVKTSGGSSATPVTVRVDVGSHACPDCGPVQGASTECPYCGSPLR